MKGESWESTIKDAAEENEWGYVQRTETILQMFVKQPSSHIVVKVKMPKGGFEEYSFI